MPTTPLDKAHKALAAAGYDVSRATYDDLLRIGNAAPDSEGRSTEPGSAWDEECAALLDDVKKIIEPCDCDAEWSDDDIEIFVA